MDINDLYKRKKIDDIDWAFAGLIRRIVQHEDPWVDLASALVSQAAANGHTCLDLAAARLQGGPYDGIGAAVAPDIDLDDWRARLVACPAVGKPGDFRPLIMTGKRLYLQRYWYYEQYVANAILRRCRPGAVVRDARVTEAARRIFGQADEAQLRAACMAAVRDFMVICGGPGTGKTFTLARIILLLQYLAADKPLRIELCAPTGKAAVRLQEAMEVAARGLPVDQRQALSRLGKARTIHRLLGSVSADPAFRYHSGRTLPADMVIVDEASMIDLALMARLMQALAPGTRLILSGDKDQLASVEAGAVLADICQGAAGLNVKAQGDEQQNLQKGLSEQIVVLQSHYRFDDASGIDELGQAVNHGNAESTLDILSQKALPEVKLRNFESWGQLAATLEGVILQNFGLLSAAADPLQALGRLKHLQVLTVLRNGPYGVQGLNAHVEKILSANGLIVRSPEDPPGWYAGRPVMVARNDYYHELFNGDMGIGLVRDAAPMASARLAVFFPAGQGALRVLAPHQLPPHETAYVMTVHKSQGSEFERVILILPDQDLPVLTRELIYTAVTRARQSVEIWGDAKLLAAAVERRIERASGLREALWG